MLVYAQPPEVHEIITLSLLPVCSSSSSVLVKQVLPMSLFFGSTFGVVTCPDSSVL